MTSLRAIALIYTTLLFALILISMNFHKYATFERQEFLLIIRIITYNSCFRRRNSIETKADDFKTAPGKTWNLRIPLGSKIMSWKGSKTRDISYFSSTRAAVSCAFLKHLYSRTPFLHFRDRCKLKGFLLDARGSKEQYPFPNSFHFFYIHLDASVSPTISSAISFPYSAANSIYSHCAFAFDGNAACRIECRDICRGRKKGVAYSKIKISTKGRRIT